MSEERLVLGSFDGRYSAIRCALESFSPPPSDDSSPLLAFSRTLGAYRKSKSRVPGGMQRRLRSSQLLVAGPCFLSCLHRICGRRAMQPACTNPRMLTSREEQKQENGSASVPARSANADEPRHRRSSTRRNQKLRNIQLVVWIS